MELRNLWLRTSVKWKLTLTFLMTTLLLFMINTFMYLNINKMITDLDEIYATNIGLNNLDDALGKVHDSMTDYLNTRSTDAIDSYYRSQQEFQRLTERLNDRKLNNDMLMVERNIRNISENYLKETEQAIEAKRGDNIEKYKMRFDRATKIKEELSDMIGCLNNRRFRKNADNYQELSKSLQYLEMINVGFLFVIGFFNLILIFMMTQQITQPLRKLSDAAREVSNGRFDIKKLPVKGYDELGIVTETFNKMLDSITEFIENERQSMIKEQELKEKTLLMESHLKDARLKYLQAQINPHFLFNTLNAGAQLALMEDAERTYSYIQKVADFFRYNVKKDHDTVSLKEEILLVDTYIYILNVRFAGDIHFSKEIDESLLNISVPSMILQPIVENSVNYGIRNIDWEGHIKLKVYRQENTLCISVYDNGVGIPVERIQKILSGQLHQGEAGSDSNGIGLDNVIRRLQLCFGEDDVMSIISEGENKGTESIIYIPLKEEDELNV